MDTLLFVTIIKFFIISILFAITLSIALFKFKNIIFVKKIGIIFTFFTFYIVSLPIFFHKSNPYSEMNIEFVEDAPGASNDFITFTPTLINNNDKRIIIGPTVGANFAEIKFKNVDDDKMKEVIIKSNKMAMMFEGGFSSNEQYVLDYIESDTGIGKFVIVSEIVIPDSTLIKHPIKEEF